MAQSATRRSVLFLVLFSISSGRVFGAGEPPVWRDANRDGVMQPYENPSLPVDKRVDDLISRMSLAEKLGQLNQRLLSADALTRWNHELERGEIGAMLPDAPVVNDARVRNAVQRIACEHSPLGIPFILGFDTIHGFRTVFPIPAAMSCSWDPELVRRASEVAARESAAVGIDWIFAPMCDIARDARWGRVAEGFGEDPWLTSRFVAATVRGFQGDKPGSPDHVVACLKHFVGYGAAEAGRDYNTVEITTRTLRDVYLPPFRAGLDAGARTVMSAFHSNGGVPASADRSLLNDLLRVEWGFDGFVVSDWTAVSEVRQHGFATDAAEAARLSLNAGVDMEMVSACYADTLPRSLIEETVTESVVDASVRRILRVKFERGLFDRPYADESLAQGAFLTSDALALARETVAKSCVLLKNNRGTLPLDVSKIRRLALIGPLADSQDEMLGTWQGQGKSEDVVTLAEGLRRAIGHEKVLVARGCPLTGTAKTVTKTDGSVVVTGAAEAGDDREIRAAIELAKTADAVVMALGEPRGWSGENASRTGLGLTGRQQELFEAVCRTGKPVIVVLFTGRPLAVPEVHEHAAAVLLAWHPGVQAGVGLSDLLTGAVEPTGRLTLTWPRSVGQCPIYYNHANTGRPQYMDYKDSPSTPLYPFGYGLGYATFAYSPTRSISRAVTKGENIVVSADIKNISMRPGEAVPQLYIRCMGDSQGVRPVRELRDYQKVRLDPGETRTVTFTVPQSALARLGQVDGKPGAIGGAYRLWISPDSDSGDYARVVVEK